MKILGRDPVVITTLTSAVLQMLNMFWFHWTSDQTAAVNAAIAIVLAAVAAALVSVDQVLPLLVGITQAVANVGLVFGLHWSADQVGSVLAVVTAFVAIWGVRPQTSAVVGQDGSRRPRVTLYGRAA